MTILVVAAHPDDEVLGCGGVVARFSAEEEIHIAILGEGLASRFEQGESPTEGIKLLREQARAAGKLLGAASTALHDLPDNRFDQVPLLEVVKIVEQAVRNLEPDVVYTHHSGDLNIDHQITFRAVLTATRPLPDCPVRELYAFEAPSSSEWAFQQLGTFKPNVFVDISSTIETKLRALACYEGEVREFPHPRSPEGLRTIARRWGSVVGVEYAEAFQLVRSLR